MSTSDPGLRRVTVQAGAATVDLVLPAAVPVATLLPPIVDILEAHHANGSGDLEAKRYQLSVPGASALDKSKTLAQSVIRDGAVLVFSQSATPPPAARYDDAAEAVTATLDATVRAWGRPQYRQATRLAGAVAAICLTGIGGLVLIQNNLSANASRYPGTVAGVAALAGVVAVLGAAIASRAYRDPTAGLALGSIATAFAAVAGFLAVPGAPGIPNVLLAAMAAAVTSVLVMRVSGSGVVPLTAVSCVALVIAIAALVGMVTAAPLQAIGSVSALGSLGLLGAAARLSIVLAGLSPRLPPASDLDLPDPAADRLSAKAIRADNWLTSLLAAFSSSAAVGAIVTALAGAPRVRCIAFAAVTGALLLARTRSIDGRRTPVLAIPGIVCIGTTFAVAALSTRAHPTRIAGTAALLAAAAMYLGFVAPAITLSPVLRRGVELAEWLALLAMAPLTCWVCGVYGAVRGLNPH